MGKCSDKQEIAKARWLAGEDISAIARDLSLHRNTVQGWKSKFGWEKIKNALPDEAPRRPQLVSFDGRDRESRKAVDIGPLPDLGTVEGQLALLDEAIGIARQQIANPSSPQQYAASVSGLSKLLDCRERIAPTDRKALLFQILEKYRDPAELLEHLKELGFGRKGANPGPKVTNINSRL